MSLAAVAIAIAAALALYPTSDINNIGPLVRLVGVAGLALMIGAVVAGARWLVGWAAVVLVVAYGLSLIGRPSIDGGVPVYAAALLLTIESAYSAIERRTGLTASRGSASREFGRLAMSAMAAGTITLVVLLLASTPVSYGLLVQVSGVGAVGAVLTTLIVLVRQRT